MKEKNEKKIENCDEISKLIKAFPNRPNEFLCLAVTSQD
jgi:hypothetical protein